MQQLIQHPNLKFIAPGIAAALIAGGSSIAGSALSFGNQQMTNSRNEALAREQNQWNLAQWYRENAYNSPAEQIKRLKQAGINPGLAYSNGIENLAGQSPQMVSSQNQASARFDLGGVAAMQALQQARSTESAIDLNKATAEDLRSQVSHREWLESIGTDDNRRAWIQLNNDIRATDAQIDDINSQIQYRDSYISLMKSQKTAQDFLNDFNERTKDLKIEIMQSEKYKNLAEANRANAEAALFKSQNETEKIVAALNSVMLVRDQQQFMRDQISLYFYYQKYKSFPEWDELQGFHFQTRAEYESAKTLALAYGNPTIRESFLNTMKNNAESEQRHSWWTNSFYGSFYNDWNGIAASVVGTCFNGNVSTNFGSSGPSAVETVTKNNPGGKRVIKRFIK